MDIVVPGGVAVFTWAPACSNASMTSVLHVASARNAIICALAATLMVVTVYVLFKDGSSDVSDAPSAMTTALAWVRPTAEPTALNALNNLATAASQSRLAAEKRDPATYLQSLKTAQTQLTAFKNALAPNTKMSALKPFTELVWWKPGDDLNWGIQILCVKAIGAGAGAVVAAGLEAAGSTVACSTLCGTAAVTADAAGGGPEEPVGDAVAAGLGIGCLGACGTAIAALGESAMGTAGFSNKVCQNLHMYGGFDGYKKY